jgi:hypothetical protein
MVVAHISIQERFGDVNLDNLGGMNSLGVP